jgi:hypothetical protein
VLLGCKGKNAFSKKQENLPRKCNDNKYSFA